MLNERRQAADAVTTGFLRAEACTDEAARLAAACVATMIEQRAKAGLPVDTGLDALDLVSGAAAALVSARQQLIRAHRALVCVREEVGLSRFGTVGYGDQSECPPLTGQVAGGARLAAVA